MAGGSGSRFWPLSRDSRPKQFLDILGTGKSLLRQTFERVNKLFPKDHIFVVTGEQYEKATKEHIPELNDAQVLLEPYRRNTAPCIAYANYKIYQINPEANIVVAPADHLIINEDDFINTLKKGLEFVSQDNALLTLGIKPHRPETGYGYIQVDNESSVSDDENLKRVRTFTEKPNPEIAQAFYESGEYYWNSGIFIWSLKTIMQAFEIHLPETDNLFKRGLDIYDTSGEKDFIQQTYGQCQNISIDNGVMEKAEDVYVYCSDFGWSDLGTWSSVYENSDKDENNNVVKNGNAINYDAYGNIIYAPEGKLVVIEGLEDYIVVDTNDALLICSKEKEQNIKRFVTDVKVEKGKDYI